MPNFKSLQDNHLAEDPAEGAIPATAQRAAFRKSSSELPRLLVLAVAVLATLPVLLNAYAYDDLPIIVQETRYPTWRTLPAIFTEPYWPPPYSPDLYRPLASILFGILRLIGGDAAPWMGHAVSVAVYALLALAVLALLRRFVSPAAALAGALLFAAHPVHAEAVANTVNTSELVVGAIMCIAVLHYVRRRAEGALSWGTIGQCAALQVLAFGWKETGVLLPALLAVAEVTLVRDARPWRTRLVSLRPAFMALTLSTLALVAVRGLVIGDFKGTSTTYVLDGQPVQIRLLTMLGVVNDWARLLVWPARLRIEYSVAEYQPIFVWGLAQTTGALLLTAAVGLFWFTRRRLPFMAFGLLMLGLGLFPVHNVLIPTGTLLAERTLLLPSIGVACMVAAALGTLRLELQPSRQRLVLAVVAILATSGVLRFALRLRDWRTNKNLWEVTVADEPRSASGWQSLGVIALDERDLAAAQQFLRRAADLNTKNPVPRTLLGDLYAGTNQCEPAQREYDRVLQIPGTHARVRLNKAVCSLWLGQYDEAHRLAMPMVADSADGRLFRELLHRADSAKAATAPPKTVRGDLKLTEDFTRLLFPGAVRKSTAGGR